MSRRPAMKRLALMVSVLLVAGLAVVLPDTPLLGNGPAAKASVAADDVVFVYNAPHQLAVRHSNGSVDVLVNLDRDESQVNPAPSPDGSRIAFPSLRGERTSGLYVVGSDGSGLTGITMSPTDNPGRFVDWFPSWCNNQTVLFLRHYSPHSGAPSTPQPQVWKVNADGSGETRVSQHDTKQYLDPECSPDGTKIVFGRQDPTIGKFQVWYMNADGSGETVVPNQPRTDNGRATWGSNSRLYFNSGVAVANIYGIDLDGTDLVQVTTSGAALYPSVSSDGGTIVYYEFGDLYSMASSGSGSPTQLTDTKERSEVNPAYVRAARPNGNTKNLVALGDSVAAGEGINYGFEWDSTTGRWVQGVSNPSWLDTTPALGGDYQQCHQSGKGYASLLELNGDNYNVHNMACTGATADNGVLGPQTSLNPDGPEQLDDSTGNPFDAHNPDVVTLTLGANDIDFAGWIRKCYHPVAGECNTTRNTRTLRDGLDEAQDDLRLVLAELDRRADAANKTVRVLVTNYYNPFPSGRALRSCIDTRAGVLNGTYPWIGLTTAEKTWLGTGLGDLNDNIAAEVTYAQSDFSNLDVDLVDIRDVMKGHEFCTSEPWAYGPSINYRPFSGISDNPASFHPTPAGQRAIYERVKDELTHDAASCA